MSRLPSLHQDGSGTLTYDESVMAAIAWHGRREIAMVRTYSMLIVKKFSGMFNFGGVPL